MHLPPVYGILFTCLKERDTMNYDEEQYTIIEEAMQLLTEQDPQALTKIMALVWNKAMLAVDSAFDEAEIHWRNVFKSLVDRGLRGLKLIVSDAHVGLEEARRLMDIAVEKYAKDQPKLASWMEENLPDGFTVFSFPEPLRKKLRTNNLEE